MEYPPLHRVFFMQPGTAIGPYRIERHLGDGGMGSVWLAEDTRLRRRVALKTLHAARQMDEAGRERLMCEARAAAALNHPHIAAVYDVIDVSGAVAIVFEYVEGATLATTLAGERLPIDRVLQIGIQLAQALASAHQQGVIHRDLKPSNVIVGRGGDVKVLDFGIARLLPAGTTEARPDETLSAGFVGTPAYAAPEQLFTSAVDERADLYALGVMLFEMATGRRPFAGQDLLAMASTKLAHKPPAMSESGAVVPPAFDALVARLLEQQPLSRPSSAAEVVGTLKAIAGDPTTGSMPSPRRARMRWIAAMVALVATVAALLLGLKGVGVATVSASQPVVAVLPLRNTSGDSSKDYLAAGLSESLIAGLASTPSLIVLSRSAVADALKADGAVAAVKELGATHVIDGSVQQSGTELRVAINLIRPDQSIAWGRTFDGSVDRVFDLQTRMALAVSEAMSAGPPAALPSAPADQSALDAYWRGRALLDRWDVAGNVDAAIATLQESVKTDPGFALAHAALGLAYWQKYSEQRDQQFARLAVEAGSQAAAINPNLPEVHYALAVSLAGTGRRDEAIAELEAALALRPTFDEARRKLGEVLAAGGRINEAIAEYKRAIALRPHYWGGYSALGLALLNAARYAEAATAFEQAVVLQPDNQMSFQQLGSSYQMMGDAAKALAAYEKALSIRESYGAYSNIGMLHHNRGDYAKAVAAYERAVAMRPNVAAGHRNVGDAYARMGRSGDAQRAYARAVERAEADLLVNPKSARNLAALAVYLVKAGRSRDADARIEGALAIAPDDLTVRYRAAVVSSLRGDRDRALAQISDLIKRGYSTSAIRDEEDFALLRNNSEFQKLVHTP
jgi:serine/threonine protein kinase/tetratricopeptide (TPR) repeat protein